MQWEVIGADRNTGRDSKILVDADTEDSARRRANRLGLLVSDLRPLDPNDSVAGAAAPAAWAGVPPPVADYAAREPAARRARRESVMPKATNGFGIASLVLGIVAALICWIPLVGLLVVPIATIGVIIGAVGILIALITKRTSASLPTAGLSVCALSMVVPFVLGGILIHAAVSALVPSLPSFRFAPTVNIGTRAPIVTPAINFTMPPAPTSQPAQ